MADFFSRLNVMVAFYAAIVVGVFAFYAMGRLLSKWRSTRSPIVGNLTISVMLWAFAIIFDPLFYTIEFFYDWPGVSFISFSTALSFGLTAVANVFMLQFVVLVFKDSRHSVLTLTLMIIEITILPASLIVYFLLSEDQTLPIYIIHILASLVVLGTFFQNARNLRKKMKMKDIRDPLAYKGVTYLMLGSLAIILTFTMFVLHEVLGLVELQPLSPFTILGYAMAGIGAILVYLGYAIPQAGKENAVKE